MHSELGAFSTRCQRVYRVTVSINNKMLVNINIASNEIEIYQAKTNSINKEHKFLVLEDKEDKDILTRITFINHLKSSITKLLIGKDKKQTALTAHQALLVQSPYLITNSY